MAHYSSKTSFERPARDRRKQDQEPLRVPPHKKPRKYRLTVTYVRTITETCVKDFTSKVSMQEFRGRVEQQIAKEKAEPARKSSRWWGFWYNSNLRMESEEKSQYKTEPQITEELIDG